MKKLLYILLVMSIFACGCGQEKLRKQMELNMQKKQAALARKSQIAARKGYLIASQTLKTKGKKDYFLCYVASGPDIDRQKGTSAYWEYLFESKDHKGRFGVIVEGGKVVSAGDQPIKIIEKVSKKSRSKTEMTKKNTSSSKEEGKPTPENWLDSTDAIKIIEAIYLKKTKNKPVPEKAFWMQLIGNSKDSFWEVYYGKNFFGKDMRPIRINALTGRYIEEEKKKENKKR